jgi:hypothetical protein
MGCCVRTDLRETGSGLVDWTVSGQGLVTGFSKCEFHDNRAFLDYLNNY